MKLLSRLVLFTLAFVMVVSTNNLVFAQQGGGRRGGRGGFGQMTPEQRAQRMKEFRQRMLDRLKQELGVNDEEWEVLKPEIEKIEKIRREIGRTRGGFGFFGRFRGRRGGEGDDPVMQARRELRDAIQQGSGIKEKLEAYRTAVKDAEKKRAELEKQLKQAREDLKALLTIKQEAVLVLFGLLE